MYNYIIQEWDTKKEKWKEIGSSYSRYVALQNIFDVKEKFPNTFYRILMVISVC